MPWEVTALAPSLVAVFVPSNSPVLSHVSVCMSACVTAPLQTLDPVKKKFFFKRLESNVFVHTSSQPRFAFTICEITYLFHSWEKNIRLFAHPATTY